VVDKNVWICLVFLGSKFGTRLAHVIATQKRRFLTQSITPMTACRMSLSGPTLCRCPKSKLCRQISSSLQTGGHKYTSIRETEYTFPGRPDAVLYSSKSRRFLSHLRRLGTKLTTGVFSGLSLRFLSNIS